MEIPNRVDLLWQILANKHHRFCVKIQDRYSSQNLLVKPANNDQAIADEYERAEALYESLKLQSDYELFRRLQHLEKHNLEAYENRHPFNQTDALATDDVFEFWSRAEFWTLGEAAALINGRNPQMITEHNIESDRSKSKIAIKLQQTLELLQRARQAGSLVHTNSPKSVIEWLELKHLEMPQRLKDMALQRSGTSFTLVAQNRQLKEKIAMLEAKPASTASQEKQVNSHKPLGPRERDSLLKLILGMAIGAYRYDPKATKSSEINEIASDLQLAGLALDDGTVRKYLNEAKALFADALTEHKT